MFSISNRSSYLVLAALAAAGMAGCSPEPVQDATPATAAVTARGETVPTESGKAAVALHWLAGDRLIGATKRNIEIYDRTGARMARFGKGKIEGLDLLPGADGAADILLALNTDDSSLEAYGLDPAAPDVEPVQTKGKLKSGRLLEGMCAYRSALDGKAYGFLLGGDGKIEQWQLTVGVDGTFGGQLTRTLQTGTEPKFCTIDPWRNSLYVSEEAVGIWQFDANPEADTVPTLVDVRTFGHLAGDVGGLALVRDPAGHAALVAADVGQGQLNVYDINAGHAWLGSVTIGAGGAVDAVDAVGDMADGLTYAHGRLLLADGDNENEGANFKLAHWADIAAGLSLDGRLVADTARPVEFGFKTVEASAETAPVAGDGDAADDPAVWINPADAAKSLIIGTNKQAGLLSYRLDGSVHQFLDIGRVNNVDIRYGVKIGDQAMTLVTATNRSHKTISILRMNAATGLMEEVADGPQATGMADPYGTCMYQSAKTGKTYVFANDKDGETSQWELAEGAPGRVKIELVRRFDVGSTAEGCVADDQTGAYYAAEEDVALWRYGAEPEDGAARTMVTSVESNPALKDDLEGVSLYYGAHGAGYIILSSQGNNSYAVFDRKESHGYLGSFMVVAGAGTGIDGSSETDGLDVTAVPMGAAFPHGAFIAQDGRNIAPAEHQNFKLVPWERIADALGLSR